MKIRHFANTGAFTHADQRAIVPVKKKKKLVLKKQNNWMNTPITGAVILLCNLKKTWQLFRNVKFFPKLFTKINV